MKSQTDFKQGNLTIETSVIVFHRVAFTLYRLDFNLEQDLTVAAFIEFAAQGFSKKFEVEFPGGGEHLQLYGCNPKGKKRDLPALLRQQKLRNVCLRYFLLENRSANIFGEKYEASTTVIASDFLPSKYHHREVFSPQPHRFCCF